MANNKTAEITAQIEQWRADAYQQGWDDAVAQIVGKAQALAAKKPISQERPASSALPRGIRANTAAEYAYREIKAYPGKAQAEIIKLVQAKDSKFKEKAVIMAIYRLIKDRDLVEIRDGGLYVKN